jgi:hypothetical protein
VHFASYCSFLSVFLALINFSRFDQCSAEVVLHLCAQPAAIAAPLALCDRWEQTLEACGFPGFDPGYDRDSREKEDSSHACRECRA